MKMTRSFPHLTKKCFLLKTEKIFGRTFRLEHEKIERIEALILVVIIWFDATAWLYGPLLLVIFPASIIISYHY